MIFPNHPAFEELRSGMGMGYQPGAHAMLGYQPGAHAMLGYHAGSHGNLGTVSDSQMQAAWDAGLDGNTIDALSAAGATDADIQALMAGTTDVPTLMAKYAGLQTTEGTTVTPTSAAHPVYAPPAPTNPAQVPSGSTVLYTATVVGGPGNLTVTPASAMSQFASALTAHGMSVVQSSNDETILNKVFGTGAPIHFQFTILDSVGNAFTSDAKSVCDGVLMGIVGNNISSSNLSVVSTPTGSASPNLNPPASDPISWLENNALYIGGAIAALVLLNNFTGRKRR